MASSTSKILYHKWTKCILNPCSSNIVNHPWGNCPFYHQTFIGNATWHFLSALLQVQGFICIFSSGVYLFKQWWENIQQHVPQIHLMHTPEAFFINFEETCFKSMVKMFCVTYMKCVLQASKNFLMFKSR